MSSTPARCSIAVVAFDGVIPFHLSVPCLVFGEGVVGANPFDVTVCAGEAGRIMTSGGFGLTKLAPLSALNEADAIIMPGWRHTLDAPPPRLLQTLRRAHARGAQIVGLCLGTHVLAAAGLLDGRRATTHWEYCVQIAACFPAVQMDSQVLYVESDNLLTSAGTAASLDVCLHVLRKRLGASVANRTARRLVVPPARDGAQAQCIERPVPEARADCRLTQLTDTLRQRLGEPHSIDSLAGEMCMSRRSLTRHFKALTGTTVQAWLLRERLTLSQRLLESSDQTIESIAEAAGFGCVASLRQHFREAFGVTPTGWRLHFRNSIAAPESPRAAVPRVVRRKPSTSVTRPIAVVKRNPALALRD
ncbi:MAG TPA: helix-turn-helix domain-containing protein [Gammaproteobacteria bacterium]|nr:helix-turn-helix domain-containing protein [Gammaproteobacteria bacterium]